MSMYLIDEDDDFIVPVSNFGILSFLISEDELDIE